MMAVPTTPVTVLQELMVKLNLTPEFECVSQTGPTHLATFEYRCVALGVVVTAKARSKKEAKQQAARAMLEQLAARGHEVPPYGPAAGVKPVGPSPDPAPLPQGPRGAPGPRSYVALLKDLCEEYKLPAAEYQQVYSKGPLLIYKVHVGARNQSFVMHTCEKEARERAAEQLFSYLRENLARVIEEFNEDDTSDRARQPRPREATVPRRLTLAKSVSSYHLAIASQLGPERLAAAATALQADRPGSPQRALAEVAAALGLTPEPAVEPEGVAVALVALRSTEPELVFAGDDADDAAATALRYLRLALALSRPDDD